MKTYKNLIIMIAISLLITSCAPRVKKIIISPDTVSGTRGQSINFTATVDGSNNPSQNVTWTVSGGVGESIISTEGILMIGWRETAESLIVTATSSIDNRKTGSANVTVQDPINIEQIKNAIVQDLQRMGVEAQAWYRTPLRAGGGGNYLDQTDKERPTNTLNGILLYIDRSANIMATTKQISTENAEYTFYWQEPILTILGVRVFHGTRIECQANITINRGFGGIQINPVVTQTP